LLLLVVVKKYYCPYQDIFHIRYVYVSVKFSGIDNNIGPKKRHNSTKEIAVAFLLTVQYFVEGQYSLESYHFNRIWSNIRMELLTWRRPKFFTIIIV